MPLTINLLHEEQYLLQQRKRDPLKLGLYALGAVAALFVLYYFVRLAASGATLSEMHAREAEWKKQEPLAAAAAKREEELSAQIATAAAITHRIENRFYWAPLVEILSRAVPPNVQLTGFTGSNDLKLDRVSLLLEGLAAGDVPRFAAEQFRTGFGERLGKTYKNVTTTFRGLDETAATVTLNGKPVPTARFSIEVSFDKPSVAPTATPAPERRARR
jgi:hypothetical protein